MKLQGASILDLVTELLTRLNAQGKDILIEQAAPALRLVLEECGHDALDCFERMGVDFPEHLPGEAAATKSARKGRK